MAPGPGVISVGHCLEPNGTAGGRNGLLAARWHLGDDRLAGVASHQLVVHQVVLLKNSAPTERSEMMRTIDTSMSSGVVVKETVSISISRSLIASGPKYCASTLNSTLFWRAT